MAEAKPGEKTLEMRVAELEDKLKGMQVTEEEMRAYQKVAALMAQGGAGGTGLAAPATVPADCIVSQCIRSCTVISNCVRNCTIISNCVRQCIVSPCVRNCTIIQDCINECGGGVGGGGIGGGGFGTLGG